MERNRKEQLGRREEERGSYRLGEKKALFRTELNEVGERLQLETQLLAQYFQD